VSIEVSDLWFRILENIHKLRAAVCGGSTRRKWRIGSYEMGSKRFGKKVLQILRIEANGTKEW
jgi:hypothetical protein